MFVFLFIPRGKTMFKKLLAAAKGKGEWPAEVRERARLDPEFAGMVEDAETLGRGGPLEVLALIQLVLQIVAALLQKFEPPAPVPPNPAN